MIRFLIKGLLRDRSRSLFPILMVSAGTFLTVMLYCYMKGAIGDMVDSSARFDTGHVKIMTRAYHQLSDQLPNDLALLGAGALIKELRRENPGMIWAPRIRFGGLLDIPDKNGLTRSQGPVLGLGVDLRSPRSREVQLLRLQKSLVKGRLPRKKDEILISQTFAQRLGAAVGDRATLISSTMYGSLSIHDFRITGTLRFGIAAVDRSTIVADLEDIRQALDMADGAGEIVGLSSDLIYARNKMTSLAQAFNSGRSSTHAEFAPVMISLGEQSELLRMLQMTDWIAAVIVAVFVLAMSVVLWNAGLMNGIRRYGEIGVRLAIGESKNQVYGRMIAESVCIGIVGSFLGTALGLTLSYLLQHYGIDFSSVMNKSSVLTPSVIRARVTPVSYVIGFLPGLAASLLGTMFAGIGIYRRQTSQLFKELEV